MSDYYTDTTDQNIQGTQSILQDADAMIRANGAADAREIEDLKATAGRYQAQVDQLQNMYQKSTQQLEMSQQRSDQIMRSNAQTLAKIQSILEELQQKAEAGSEVDWSALEKHIDDAAYEAGRKAEDAVNAAEDNLHGALSDAQDKIADLIQQSDDFSHKENVRVYRNVQAATDQLLQKQTEELRVDINSAKPGEGRAKPSGVSVAALVVSLVTLAYVVCDSLGIVQAILQLF